MYILKTHKNLLWLFFLLFLGTLIRIYNLGSHNLWHDEFWSYLISRNFVLPKNDFNPSLYYILLAIWTGFFGITEFAMRSLSMLFGALSIVLIYKLGKLFFDIRSGLISAFILSISPIHIWYSQEAKGYSMTTFLAMLTVYIFILSLKNNKIYLWAGFILSSILALYANYFCFFSIILVAILFLLNKDYKPFFRHYLVTLGFILLAFLPIIPAFFKSITRIRDIFWIPKPDLNSIAITFENFNVGYNATPWIYFFTFMIFSSLFILGIQRCWQEKRTELISLISFLFVPIILTFLISQRIPIYLDRQLMVFSPFYYIIIAAGLAKIKMPIIKTTAYLSISLPILFCLYNYFSYCMPLPQYHHRGVYVKKPVKPAADYIKSGFKKGDLIIFSDLSIYNIFYYIPVQYVYAFVDSELKKYYVYKSIKESIKFALQNNPNRIRKFIVLGKSTIPAVKDIKQLDFERTWLVSSSWARDGKLNSHVMAVRKFMQDNYLFLETKEFDGIFVDLYTK